MSTAHYLGILSGVFLIAGYVPYIYEVFKRTSVPNRMSWFIWSLSTAIVLFGLKETGTQDAIWVPIADAVGCFIVFALSLFIGTGGWTKTDKIAFGISLLSLLVLWITGNVLVALFTNLLIYISGYIPTIKKSIKDPKSESLVAWTLFLIGVLLNFITVVIGTDTGLALWLYLTAHIVTVGTLYFFLIRRYFVKN